MNIFVFKHTHFMTNWAQEKLDEDGDIFITKHDPASTACGTTGEDAARLTVLVTCPNCKKDPRFALAQLDQLCL